MTNRPKKTTGIKTKCQRLIECIWGVVVLIIFLFSYNDLDIFVRARTPINRRIKKLQKQSLPSTNGAKM